MNTTLVIMAAGVGSRFGGGIKQLEPLGPNGEILMEYSIYDAIEAGFNKVVFITREDLYETFEEAVGKKIRTRIPVEYVFQKISDIPAACIMPEDRKKPWGTGQAVLICKDIVKEPFVVINADDYYGKKAFKMIHDHLLEEKLDNSKYHFCMAGFILGNTLSDNGTVTRGVCILDETDNLLAVNETENIEKDKNGKVFGKTKANDTIELDANSNVSMNMWGFTPEVFVELEEGFKTFLLDPETNPEKSEYLLPKVVDDLIKEDKAEVKVLETPDKWFGVTYAADKELVEGALASLVNEGVYPKNL